MTVSKNRYAVWIDVKNFSVSVDDTILLEIRNFIVPWGVSLGIIGESGGGKTTFAKALVGLLNPSLGYRINGYVRVHGKNVYEIQFEDRIKLYWRWFTFLFQDSMSMFDPVRPVGIQIAETVQKLKISVDPKQYLQDLFMKLQLTPPDKIYNKFPYEFSGGMLRRCAIIYALLGNPEIVVLDEFTTGLNKELVAMVVKVYEDFLKSRHLILISHDLRLINSLADWLAVIYKGRIVEFGMTRKIFKNPQHPYTQLLLDVLKNKELTDKDFREKWISVRGHYRKTKTINFKKFEEDHYVSME